MSFWRKEKSKDVKMPFWVNPKLHRKVKEHCVLCDISIRDFVESAIGKELKWEQKGECLNCNAFYGEKN